MGKIGTFDVAKVVLHEMGFDYKRCEHLALIANVFLVSDRQRYQE